MSDMHAHFDAHLGEVAGDGVEEEIMTNKNAAFEWEDHLRIKLADCIETAMAEVDAHFMQEEGRAVFPWIGDNTSRIMANAAIAVLKGIEDVQEYLKEDGLLEE